VALKLDLSKVFNKLAFNYAKELNDMIRKQFDMDGNSYVPVPRRVKSGTRKGKTVKAYTKSGKRLVNTGVFNRKAFIGKFGSGSMSIEGNPASYDGNVTFNDIIQYNDKNSKELRGAHGATIKIRGPAMVPRTEADFFSTDVGATIIPTIEVELFKQIEEEVAKNIVKNLKLKLTP